MVWCIVLILFIILYFKYSEGYTAERLREINKHKELFIAGPLTSIKSKLDWVDPIDYYDIKRALISGGSTFDLMAEPK